MRMSAGIESFLSLMTANDDLPQVLKLLLKGLGRSAVIEDERTPTGGANV